MRTKAACVLALAYALSACSDDAPPASAPLPVEEYCSVTAEAVCSVFDSCCGSGSAPFVHAGCLARVMTDCDAQRAARTANGSIYDPAAARDCVNSASLRLSDCTRQYEPGAEYEAAVARCAEVWSGALSLGEACGIDSSACAPDPGGQVACQPPSGSAEGVCTLQPFAEIGETCVMSGSALACRYGAFCDLTSRVCTAKKVDGEPCMSRLECLSPRCEGGTCGPDELVAFCDRVSRAP
jgi:hypothetical protein